MDLTKTPLWTALITPMHTDGSVDYNSLEKLVRAQEEAGNGLLVLGSTGEALNLDEEEKDKILSFVIGLKPKTPIMAGIGGINLKATLASIKKYEALTGIHAYLMVTPLYAKPGARGQEQWFRALMDASSRPCMLYNVPGRSAVAMHKDAVRNLVGHKNFWAIKEASGSVEEFRGYRDACQNKVALYSGDDALLPDFVPNGACGLVSVASNSWPMATALYTKMALDHSLTHADLWRDASGALFLASNPVPVKVLMHHKGMIETPVLRAPLTHEDMVKSDMLFAADRNINEWLMAQKK
jgi:4-hydroxy-tetrahydrodipicolinate synthase